MRSGNSWIKSMAADNTNSLESMVLPTICLIIGAVASIVSMFLALKGLYIWLLPSGFIVLAFGALGFVSRHIRVKVQRHNNGRN